MGYSKLINAVEAFHDANRSLYVSHQKDVRPSGCFFCHSSAGLFPLGHIKNNPLLPAGFDINYYKLVNISLFMAGWVRTWITFHDKKWFNLSKPLTKFENHQAVKKIEEHFSS